MGVRCTGTGEVVGSLLKLIRSRFFIIFKIDLVLVIVLVLILSEFKRIISPDDFRQNGSYLIRLILESKFSVNLVTIELHGQSFGKTKFLPAIVSIIHAWTFDFFHHNAVIPKKSFGNPFLRIT